MDETARKEAEYQFNSIIGTKAMTFDSTAQLLSVFVEQPLRRVGAAPRLGGIRRGFSPSTRPRTDPDKLIATFGVLRDVTITLLIKFMILPSHRASVFISFAT
jgi:hypothetical protein